jgi:PAS domain S-box-containing protein
MLNMGVPAQKINMLYAAFCEKEQAVVITNTEYIVQYVNEPFLHMTGYTYNDLIGRKPSFLQGALTTPQSVSYVREQLAAQVPFEADIINYRKNGEAYICHIAISPYIENDLLTHFIAFENEKEVIATPLPKPQEVALIEQLHYLCIEKKIYRHKQLQLGDIAHMLDVSARRLSEMILRVEQKSFVEFINDYRVHEVEDQLKQSAHLHKTIEAISSDAGFNSKNTFYLAFKKISHTTPSEYISRLLKS